MSRFRDLVLLGELAGEADPAFLATPEFARARKQWIGLLDGLVRDAQSEGSMRADVGTGDIVLLLNVFTCHLAELPVHVAAQPARFLHLMLDGLRAGGATELPGEPATP
ncbi:hypothetical protein OHA77_10430 [Streptosporangium sp. NBC_01639]|uniref:SbtR family transcriptional regulator n=1 Tax=Streptosporangium sp. NBC_01639 TaxID=2975948 RepID=UPI00386BA73E|nr:hypothetical protein OHA77_10430 [Streptosporangium sp. NBC_01639]